MSASQVYFKMAESQTQDIEKVILRVVSISTSISAITREVELVNNSQTMEVEKRLFSVPFSTFGQL